MFLIASGRAPESQRELQLALEEGVAQAFGVEAAAGRVQVSGGWPHLQQLAVNLTGGRVDPLRPPQAPGRIESPHGEPWVTSQRLELAAEPLFLGDSGRLHLQVEAAQAELRLAWDDRRRLWLLPNHFASGTAMVSIAGGDLEHMFLEGAERAAAEHGVVVEEGRLKLGQSGALELRIEAELLARKLFVKSRIRLRGRIGFDEQLNLHFTQLSCEGTGMVATIACKFLQPHLEAWERHPLPLLSLALPGVRLRHAQLTTDASGRLAATAELGGVSKCNG